MPVTVTIVPPEPVPAATQKPSWWTQDLDDALHMLRTEMGKVGMVELRLFPTGLKYKVVRTEEGEL